MRANDFIQEGVNDPAIFKAMFIVGGPGSGKTYVSSKLGLNTMGYVTINSDSAFEYMMKKHKLDPKMPEREQPERDIVRQRAKDITASKSELAIQGRLGVLIDGTGDEFEKISRLKSNFEAIGYDSYLIVVNAQLDVAVERNRQRPRTVPEKIVIDKWYSVQNNIGKFARIFDNMSIIDNSGNIEATNEQIDDAYKKIAKFTKTPPTKPIAKNWIEQNQNTNEASYPGNLGMMEMYKFKQIASPKMWGKMKKLIAAGKQQAAWDLLQKVTNTKLK